MWFKTDPKSWNTCLATNCEKKFLPEILPEQTNILRDFRYQCWWELPPAISLFLEFVPSISLGPLYSDLASAFTTLLILLLLLHLLTTFTHMPGCRSPSPADDSNLSVPGVPVFLQAPAKLSALPSSPSCQALRPANFLRGGGLSLVGVSINDWCSKLAAVHDTAL